MKTYEITYLTVNEESHDAATIADTLSQHGAKIVSVHPWGARRKLAFPINKQDQAFYTTVIFEAETPAIQPIESALRLNNDVLRNIIIHFVPGVFHRTQQSEDADSRDKSATKEKTNEATPEEAVSETPPTETPVPQSEEKEVLTEATAESEETEEKPKRKRATKKTEEDPETLDKKIDELLNEDITA